VGAERKEVGGGVAPTGTPNGGGASRYIGACEGAGGADERVEARRCVGPAVAGRGVTAAAGTDEGAGAGGGQLVTRERSATTWR